MTGELTCIRCGGTFVGGACKGCGRDLDGKRRTPVGIIDARAGLAAARSRLEAAGIERPDSCRVAGRMGYVEWCEAVAACTCPVHAGER